ncbi:ribonuclease H-like domain-containing protein, partial [Tanacetum coccineum]
EDDITDFGCHDTDLCDYISFIDNTLCPANLNLKKFKLYINYYSVVNCDYKSRVNSWIRYAISRNVEDVDLWLRDAGVGQEFTYDDELFFNNLCFNRVKVSYCEFNPPNGAISWGRLECLCLSYVTLYEDMIEKILSGSPCLESLELKNCPSYRWIDVTSRSVKKLVLSDYYYIEEDYIDCIKINAPYISSLTIKGEFEVKLVLLDVSSLIKAELEYSIDSGMSDDINFRRNACIYSHLKAHGDISNSCSVLLKS